MRKVAIATKPDTAFRRAIIYDPADGDDGVSVFLYRSLDDGPCDCDYWYEDMAGAERHAAEAIGVGEAEWRSVPDPHPGCLEDWLAPVRLVRDAAGHPVYGHFERLPV
jgi:hypothetical protein